MTINKAELLKQLKNNTRVQNKGLIEYLAATNPAIRVIQELADNVVFNYKHSGSLTGKYGLYINRLTSNKQGVHVELSGTAYEGATTVLTPAQVINASRQGDIESKLSVTIQILLRVLTSHKITGYSLFGESKLSDEDKVNRLLSDEELSQYQIAKDTGVAQSKLSRMANNDIKFDNLTYGVVSKLAKYYDSIAK